MRGAATAGPLHVPDTDVAAPDLVLSPAFADHATQTLRQINQCRAVLGAGGAYRSHRAAGGAHGKPLKRGTLVLARILLDGAACDAEWRVRMA